ncbi:cytochrome o ubiquinol oxidase subunit IV [Alicyclobacillus cellulosilyticus]|uniref:Cytochrome o ubiquinol oxidase subunit IV n=1 Tax=Alicyclobacillus cellulosilyticus TaxID=1003997 RepID=A0A917NHS1_9BACL|nr:cytochrome C oxidase subunit IV family protein [Alicyclobacillus cellulosilyticus]GGI99120.1 cytochrome o ubiquinol oxidase subunit IV [Alicyclobacillus cellulosilyticus]
MANASGQHTAFGPGPGAHGEEEHKHGAGLYIAGYILSLVLTAISFWLALTRAMPLGPLMLVLIILAGLQIVVQLFFFMHVTEGDGPPWHSMALLLGLIFTFAIALMSMWIMSFHYQVQ